MLSGYQVHQPSDHLGGPMLLGRCTLLSSSSNHVSLYSHLILDGTLQIIDIKFAKFFGKEEKAQRFTLYLHAAQGTHAMHMGILPG